MEFWSPLGCIRFDTQKVIWCQIYAVSDMAMCDFKTAASAKNPGVPCQVTGGLVLQIWFTGH